MTKKKHDGEPYQPPVYFGACDWAHNHWSVTSEPIVAVYVLYTKSCSGARHFENDGVKSYDSKIP
jgi:hypothetical protein